MNPFAGLRDAKIFGSGSYFKDGVYDVQIAKSDWIKTRKGKDAYTVSCTVLASNNPEIKPGEKRDWFQDMTADAGFGSLKEFIYAVVGIKDWTREVERVQELDELVPDPSDPKNKISKLELIAIESVQKNSFEGTKLRLQVTTKITKVNKKEFSVHKWEPYPEAA